MIQKGNPFKNEFNALQAQQFSLQVTDIQYRNYGNNIVLLKDSQGQPTLVLGPHWYIFLFAFLSTITLLILMLYSLKNQLHPIWFYGLIFFSIIYAYSYLRVGLSNPGFAQPSITLPHPAAQYCQICRVVRVRNVYHCQDCNVCIEGFDHHCPWVGKCIGAKNLSSFYFFLIMIFGILVLCFIATLTSTNVNKSTHTNGNLIVTG